MLIVKDDSKILSTNDAVSVLNKTNASKKSAIVFDNKEQIMVFMMDGETNVMSFLGNYKLWYKYIKKNYKYGRFNEYKANDKEIVGSTELVDKLKNYTDYFIVDMVVKGLAS